MHCKQCNEVLGPNTYCNVLRLLLTNVNWTNQNMSNWTRIKYSLTYT